MMKHRLSTAVLALFALLAVACGGSIDSQEDAMEASMDVMEDMAAVLEGVTDKASADAAIPEIEALGERLSEISKQKAKLPEPTAEEMEALQKEYMPKVGESMGKVMQQIMKLAQYPELGRAVDKAMSAGE